MNRIKAEVLEKPDDWHDEWKRPEHHGTWGYTPE